MGRRVTPLSIACCLFILCACTLSALAAKNFYTLLGVKKDANDRQIKKAYMKLAKELHPDVNKDDPEAASKFAEVANAYEVLSDKEKRRIYDQGGEEGLKQHKNNQAAGGGGGFGGFGFPFGNIFGQQQQQNPEDQRGDDITLELHATLEDLYNGRQLEVAVKKQVLCPKCRGTGAKSEDDIKTCPVCKGKGHKITIQQLGPGFVQQVQTECDRCHGKGKIIGAQCPHCSGKKIVNGESILDVFIEAGQPEGHVINFENAADERPDKNAGHIHFKIKTLPHKHFQRAGNDLHYTIHISLLESLVGFSKTVTHLDGHKVTLQRDRVTEHGFVMVVKGEGMPYYGNASKKGDMHVKFIVDFPKKLSPEQRKGFGELLK